MSTNKVVIEAVILDAGLLRAFTSGYMPDTATDAERVEELLANLLAPTITGVQVKRTSLVATSMNNYVPQATFKVGKVYTSQSRRNAYYGMRFRVDKVNPSRLSCTYLSGGNSRARWAIPGKSKIAVPKDMLDPTTEADS